MPRLMEALGIFHDQHDRYEEAYTLCWITIAQRAAGHDAPARRAWQRALPILSDLGDDLPAFESFAAEDVSTEPMSSDSPERQMGRQARRYRR
jgi:hypothetical protein